MGPGKAAHFAQPPACLGWAGKIQGEEVSRKRCCEMQSLQTSRAAHLIFHITENLGHAFRGWGSWGLHPSHAPAAKVQSLWRNNSWAFAQNVRVSCCLWVSLRAASEVKGAEPSLWITGIASDMWVAGEPKSPASSAGGHILQPTAPLWGEDVQHKPTKEADEATGRLRYIHRVICGK